MLPIVGASHLQLHCLACAFAQYNRSRNLCRMGFRIDASVLSWIQLPIFESLHRFTSRFFLNLRAIASHQPRTRSETLTRPSIFPAIRTRHTSNQPGLPTTYFCVETDMDKSIHTNETNRQKGGIQQAEIFALEVLALQPHHGDGHDPASKNDVTEELSWR